MKFKILCFFFFRLVVFRSVFYAQSSDDLGSDAQVVYFSQFVDGVINRLPDIQLNNLKILQSQTAQLRAKKSHDWIWEVRGGGFQESDFTGNIDSPFVFQSGWEINSSVKKAFASTGGRMNLDFLYRQFIARGVVDGITESRQFFVPTLLLEYFQPLLKNVFGVLDRFPMLLAGLENKITEWTVEEENAYLLSNYKKIYMQWVVYAQIREFLIEALKNAQELEKISVNQLRVGYIDEVDFQNAKMLILDIENELIDVHNTYTNLMEQVSYIVAKSNIKPDLHEWTLMNESIENNSFQGITFDQTRQALIFDFMSQKLKHSVQALKNSRLPELNALFSVAMEVYSTNNASQVNQMLIVPAFYAGLQLVYPFGNIEYKAQNLEYRKNSLEYQYLIEKAQKDFERKMTEKKRNLLFYREKVQNRQKVTESFGKRYLAQYNRFSQGRGSLASLVETKNDMLKNRIDEADIQLRLIFEYFDYLMMNNQDEISRQSSLR